VDTPDYLIGEEIYIANVSGSANQVALRYMFNPGLDGVSASCYSGSVGSLDVHYSSGVANHFYYLLSEGTTDKTFSGVLHHSPVCSGGSLAGIGRTKAEKIWFRALTVYFTSGTDYAGARAATLAAATDLYGGASAEYNAVAATWSAVSVN
jgi:Zn-dependent metalloprotease